jgi:hypothetical protein
MDARLHMSGAKKNEVEEAAWSFSVVESLIIFPGEFDG